MSQLKHVGSKLIAKESDSWEGPKNSQEAHSYQGQKFKLDGITYDNKDENFITKLKNKISRLFHHPLAKNNDEH